VTSGPTHEPIDPVRFIGNRSSGKQGHAIAQALNDAGASVTLVTGPVNLPDPLGLRTVRVQTAAEMYAAVQEALPADIAVCAAAVSDWRVMQPTSNKIKKNGGAPPLLQLSENQDILKSISAHDTLRPSLVIGFAAETENLLENAKAKRLKKSCDWILANDVSDNVFGAEENHVYLIKDNDMKEWPRTSKEMIARDLTQEIIDYFNPQKLPQAAE
jgi:phosphopantothenoylcysteine decarboxylase/phosphopantothenate--cysteine ligase